MALAVAAIPLTALGANPYLARARELYAHQQFEEADRQLQLARQLPTDDVAEKVAVLDLLARCEIAQGQHAQAEDTYLALLQLQARWAPPPGTSPKIVQIFRAARARAFPDRTARLVPGPAVAGRRIRVHLIDPYHLVQQLRLRTRTGSGSWQESSPPNVERLDLALPNSPQPLAWTLEALGEDGGMLAQLGSATDPQVSPPDPDLSPVPTIASGPAPLLVRPSSPAVFPVRHLAGWSLVGVAAACAVGAVTAQLLSNRSASLAREAAWADTALGQQARANAQADWALGLTVAAGATGAAGALVLTW